MLKRVVLAVVALVLATAPTWAGDDAKGKKPRKGDPEAQFKKLDANNDGKVSKEEFAKFMESNPKAQTRPGAADKMFGRLDTNGDGGLNLDEFKKMGERKKKDK